MRTIALAGYGVLLGALIHAGCSSGSIEEADAEPLAIATFDVDAPFGEAPHRVAFHWRILARNPASLTCGIDFDGDGVADRDVGACAADTVAAALEKQPSHVYETEGAYDPVLIVRDADGHEARRSARVYANKLVFAKNVWFPEKLPGFVSATFDGVVAQVTFASASAVPDLAPGTILWGTSAGGYLGRILTVETTGASLRATLEPVLLTDAIERGFFGARDEAAAMTDAKCLDGCEGTKLEPIRSAGTGPVVKSLGSSRAPLRIDGSGKVGLKIDFPELDLGESRKLASSVFVGMAIDKLVVDIPKAGTLKEFTIAGTPQIERSVAITTSSFFGKSLEKDFKLGTFSLGTIPLGPVIIAPVFVPTISVGASVSIEYADSFSFPFTVSYDGATFKTSSSPLLSPTYKPFAATLTAGLEATVALKPKLDFLVMGLAGPYVSPVMSVTAGVSVSTDGKGVCLNVKGGVGGEFGLECPWIPGANVKKSFSLASVTVYEKCRCDATCADRGAACGSVSDGCGGTLACGACGGGLTCSANKCVSSTCAPKTCADLGAQCGSTVDGCGKTLACGTCGTGATCTANKCVVTGGSCTPKTCAGVGAKCGSVADGCGKTLACGACATGETCSGNVCVAGTCTKKTCATAGADCGTVSDGCSGTLSCGTCATGSTCSANKCVTGTTPTWDCAKSAYGDAQYWTCSGSSRFRCAGTTPTEEKCGALGCFSAGLGKDDACMVADATWACAGSAYGGAQYWTCDGASTMHKCIGTSPAKVTCSKGCTKKTLGVDDTCN